MTDKPTWDRDAVHDMVRARHHFYQDVVTRLMRVETNLLEAAGESPQAEIAKLTTNIASIEKLGGDASALRQKVTDLEARHAEYAPELAKVQDQLTKARECLKWADMAHEGMHWIGFAESNYEKAIA